ncbi:hypothetical protein QR680_019309 [Steinernema hermaphroditum]|uniref:Carbonyl reductase n=1 Tax=Steinernema hermaphroditum TaxID=289476 RepID=A0AA39GPE0_9BILA|nr:hypothetical protein QR680_019309 [Steinernema hermaphroditum]
MSKRVFVVTGSNRGIGYAIVKGIAEKVENAVVYMTARKLEEGEKASEEIRKILGERLKSEIKTVQLDITDAESGKRLAEHIQKEHGGFDVLVNNAGFAFKVNATDPASVQADVTIGINYYGTKLISSILLPLIRPNGRVVNICSMCGQMPGHFSQELIDVLHNPNVSYADVDKFVEDYKELAKGDGRKAAGYPESAYRVSKAAAIALTMIQARELKEKNVTVNGCCPGYVATNMSSYKGPLTIEEGADTPLYLALEEDVPHGAFVKKRQVSEW